MYGTPIWPVTAEMIRFLNGGVALFIILLTTIYAGELVWRERQLRADGATDALPVPTSVVVGGKLLGFVGAMGVMLVVVMLATIGVQTFKGYHHYELPLYLQALLGVVWPTTVELTLLALLVHTLVNNKYVGHVVMIRVLRADGGVGDVGIRARAVPVRPAAGLRLLRHEPVRALRAVHDVGDDLQLRDRRGAARPGVSVLGAGRGRWVAGAIQECGGPVALRRDAARRRPHRSRCGRERRVRLLQHGDPQPVSRAPRTSRATRWRTRRTTGTSRIWRSRGIVGVRIRADLVPERRAFALQSVYRIVNKHTRPLDSLLVSLPAVGFGSNISGGVFAEGGYRMDSLVWSKPNRVLFADSARGVYLYRLTTPLAPGDSMTLSFGGHFSPAGFPNAHPNNDIVANGTFLNNSYFPGLGYDDGPELADDDKRKEHKLGPKARAHPIGDTLAREDNALSSDADWIRFDAEVSTVARPDRDRAGLPPARSMENGRRVFYVPHGHADRQSVFDPVGSLRGAPRPVQGCGDRRLLSRRSRIRRRSDDRCDEAWAGLLHGELQPLSVPPVPHHRVSAVSGVRRVVPEHRSILRGYRVRRPGPEPG